MRLVSPTPAPPAAGGIGEIGVRLALLERRIGEVARVRIEVGIDIEHFDGGGEFRGLVVPHVKDRHPLGKNRPDRVRNGENLSNHSRFTLLPRPLTIRADSGTQITERVENDNGLIIP